MDTFFQQNSLCPHTMNVTLVALHVVLGSRVLSNSFLSASCVGGPGCHVHQA